MGHEQHGAKAVGEPTAWKPSTARGNRRSVEAHANGKGFTLIELLVVVAVAAILAVIAYGSYSNQIVRTHRVAAQNAMLEIANRQQQHFTSNRIYANDLTPLGYSLPPEVASRYTLTLAANNAATPPTFLITLTPIAGTTQAGDGALTLNQAGEKTPAEKWK